MLKAFVLCAMFFLPHVAFSQNKVISGKVVDSKDGSPLQGVTVNARNSTTTTVTATDGTFRLSIPATAKSLVFSYVGFGLQEVSIQGTTTANVSMVSNNTSLGEVVVVGYGTQKKATTPYYLNQVNDSTLKADAPLKMFPMVDEKRSRHDCDTAVSAVAGLR